MTINTEFDIGDIVYFRARGSENVAEDKVWQVNIIITSGDLKINYLLEYSGENIFENDLHRDRTGIVNELVKIEVHEHKKRIEHLKSLLPGENCDS